MEYARPLFWNVSHWSELVLYGLTFVTIVSLLAGLYWRIRKWRIGQPDPGAGSIVSRLFGLLKCARLWDLIKNALFQWRLSKDPFATLMHLAIFWGMVVLALGTAVATVDQDFTNLPFDFQILQGDIYCLFELALDVFGVVLIVGLTMAAYRRYLARPERLKATVARISKWDGFPFLTVLFLIAATGFVVEGLRIAEGFRIEEKLAAAGELGGELGEQQKLRVLEEFGMEENLHLLGDDRRAAEMGRMAEQNEIFPAAPWAPVGYGLAKLFAPLSVESIRWLHQATWWVHALLAFGFMICIPFTKAFHLISSPLNMFFRDPSPAGKLTVTAESGVGRIGEFTWRQLLQIDSCTWCGKCQEVCPAHATGFPLSPRDVVQKLDGVLIRAAASGGSDAAAQTPSVHGEVVAGEELWACCTCRACEDICPVFVEHPRLIVDMRRHLVDQGAIDEGVQDALMSLQRYGNSFAQSARKRAAWAKDLDVPIKNALKEEVEYLWLVGDYASYDRRVQEVTRATAQAFQRADLDVGLLFEKEQNAGNDVRRIGEEGLFEMLQEKNAKVLEKAKFQQIVTTDPHTYNTLKNEYAADGPLQGRVVLHYTELFDQLITQGKLGFEKRLGYTATYHDPCYLGRYNGVYEPPRRVLAALGVTLVEMPRNRDNSFCCGAGGGRIWMKDVPGIEERPAENRIREALSLPTVAYFVVACPKDLGMFEDAVKTLNAEDRLKVVDLGELVYEAMVD